MIYNSVLELIGNTPMVRINRMNPNPKVTIYAKLEKYNPGGSVKDRIAHYMISKAEKEGLLTKDMTILEPTSGNTGIGLALVAAVKGYRAQFVMPETMSIERRKMVKAFGASVVLTAGERRTDGAIEHARMLAKNAGKYFMPDQFSNPANVLAHYETTAREIIADVGPELRMFVAGMGTSGTLMGVSKRLKEYNPGIRVVGVEPFPGHMLAGLKNMDTEARPGIYNPAAMDEKVNVRDEDASATARELAIKEGLFVGMSSGAAMHAAIRKARELDGGIIVVIFPDGGDRYLSTPLFE